MFARLVQNVQLIAAKSWSFLRPKQKLGLISFVFLATGVIVTWLVLTPAASADIVTWVRDTFADLFFALAGFLIKLTFFVLKFIIEIAGYNGYIDSPAVTVGWVMVRDLTNMFFIVVLLIISFGTILGLEHYEYKHMLVKLLIAAVIVNFSRIICGIIIDIAQLVMITFVNGIAATASGNLVNMFNVQEIFKLGSGTDAGNLSGNMVFLASVAALVFGTMMLVTMSTFLILLVGRMAMLWVLIVLSPLAFVFNVLEQTEKYAHEWWEEFNHNVISGPIVVFFLWLSFVTVGTGAVHDEIKKHNALSEDQQISTDPTNKEEQTGITEVMSWTKMANFVIAIAMLLAGAKMAEQLGVIGGSAMGAAKDIGKKVAMYASGYSAARWGASKAWEGAKASGKFLAMKAPVIGGNAWKRRGKKIAARAGFAWGRLTERRDSAAKGLEDWGKDEKGLKGGFKRFFGGLAAGVVESEGRKDKRVEDWEKAAKLQHELNDENYSVSSASGGQAKLKTDIRLKQIMKQAEGNKKQKYAKEEDRMTTRKEIFELEEELEHAEPENKHHIEEEIGKLRALYKKTFKEDVGAKTFDDKKFAERGEIGVESKAHGMQLEEKLHRHHEIEEAEERDKQSKIPGGRGYADQVRAKHAKEDQERAAVSSYDKSMNKLQLISKELAKPDLTDEILKTIKEKNSSEEEVAKELKKYLKPGMRELLLTERNNLQMANIKRGPIFGVNGQNTVLKESEIVPHTAEADITEANLLAQQANFLSTQLNKRIEAAPKAISHALEELEEMMGSAYMEQMVDSLAGMADEGAVNFVGMFRPKIDPKTNRTKVEATRLVEEKDDKGKVVRESDEEYVKGKRDWAVSQSRLGKTGFEGSIDSVVGADGVAKSMMQSVRALENLSNMFAGLTRSTKVDPNAVATITQAIKNGSNTKDIVAAIKRQAGGIDGVVMLLKRINENLEKKGDLERYIAELEEEDRLNKSKSKNQSSTKDDDGDED